MNDNRSKASTTCNREATPIIFLDIDGPLLTSDGWALAMAGQGAHPTDILGNPYRMPGAVRHSRFAVDSVSMVRALRAKHNARFVVHSDWTASVGMENTMQALLDNGFEVGDFHEDWCLLAALLRGYHQHNADRMYEQWNAVQRDGDGRQWRIPMWLQLHAETERFVIFDDLPILPWQRMQKGGPAGLKMLICGPVPYASQWTATNHHQLVWVRSRCGISASDVCQADDLLALPVADPMWRH